MKGAQEGRRITQPSPYSLTNPIKSSQVQRENSLRGISRQGFTFNVPNGASIQNLQIPGDCFFILGHFASWDNTTFPGFNVPLTLSLNNQNIDSAVDLALLNINRFLVEPGWVPLNKVVSPTSILTLSFNNGTGVTVTNVNYIIVYTGSII